MREFKYSRGGVIPSPQDARDFKISQAVDDPESVELPEKFEVWTPANYDQGYAGSCVACTLSAIYDCIKHKFEDEYKQHSVGFIYGNRKKDGFKYSGMIPRYACDNTVDYGDILSEVWDSPHDMPEIAEEFTEAFKKYGDITFKPFSKYVALNTIDEAKTFIYKYKIPIMICTQSKNIDKRCEGSHALLCYGWNGNKLLWQNSWHTYKARGEISFAKLYDVWGLVPRYIDFTDVTKDDWYYTDIMEGYYNGFALGYPDRTFKPDNSITRAEFVVMLNRLLKSDKTDILRDIT